MELKPSPENADKPPSQANNPFRVSETDDLRPSAAEGADRGRYRRRVASHVPQFSLKALFGVTAGMACLFALLTSCGLGAEDIVVSFLGSAFAMVVAVLLINLAWSGSGRPPFRPMSRCTQCGSYVRAGEGCLCGIHYRNLDGSAPRPSASPFKYLGVNATQLHFASAALLAVIALILLGFAAVRVSLIVGALAVLALVLTVVTGAVRQVRGEIVVVFLALAPLVIAALAIGYFLMS